MLYGLINRYRLWVGGTLARFMISLIAITILLVGFSYLVVVGQSVIWAMLTIVVFGLIIFALLIDNSSERADNEGYRREAFHLTEQVRSLEMCIRGGYAIVVTQPGNGDLIYAEGWDFLQRDVTIVYNPYPYPVIFYLRRGNSLVATRTIAPQPGDRFYITSTANRLVVAEEPSIVTRHEAVQGTK